MTSYKCNCSGGHEGRNRTSSVCTNNNSCNILVTASLLGKQRQCDRIKTSLGHQPSTQDNTINHPLLLWCNTIYVTAAGKPARFNLSVSQGIIMKMGPSVWRMEEGFF